MPIHHITRAVAAIDVAVAAILFLGAIFGLYFVRSDGVRLGMVAAFTLAFALSVAALTNAKRSEVFAATAGYAAVLVVFVSSNLGQQAPASCVVVWANGTVAGNISTLGQVQ